MSATLSTNEELSTVYEIYVTASRAELIAECNKLKVEHRASMTTEDLARAILVALYEEPTVAAWETSRRQIAAADIVLRSGCQVVHVRATSRPMPPLWMYGASVTEVGPDWIIMNAPRPLYGHAEAQGDFLHGIFYVAIDPTGYHADWMIEQNRQSDAVIVIPLGEEAFSAALAALRKNLVDRYGEKVVADVEMREPHYLEHRVLEEMDKVANKQKSDD